MPVSVVETRNGVDRGRRAGPDAEPDLAVGIHVEHPVVLATRTGTVGDTCAVVLQPDELAAGGRRGLEPDHFAIGHRTRYRHAGGTGRVNARGVSSGTGRVCRLHCEVRRLISERSDLTLRPRRVVRAGPAIAGRVDGSRSRRVVELPVQIRPEIVGLSRVVVGRHGPGVGRVEGRRRERGFGGRQQQRERRDGGVARPPGQCGCEAPERGGGSKACWAEEAEMAKPRETSSRGGCARRTYLDVRWNRDCGAESDVRINPRLGQEATIRVARLRPAFGPCVSLRRLERIADRRRPAARIRSIARPADFVAITHDQQCSEPDRGEE